VSALEGFCFRKGLLGVIAQALPPRAGHESTGMCGKLTR
jgi:hypothetical protein